ncbi:MAG TPA: phosphohistidine phosphatase SixA [Acidobacteriaceae bacterium]|nr:phosphohistidine phosphatase SixA [Acidobacteriaceae bacterium]
MNLYLLRHANAGQRRPNSELDLKRPLDKEGKQQCLLIGSVLSALKVQFDCVVSSPLKRALQTASLVGTETGYEQRIVVNPALSPSGTWREFLALLEGLTGHEDVLLVGHSPNLTQFLNTLLCSSANVAPIRMRKGAVAKLDMNRKTGRLQWLFDPRLVRAVQTSSVKRSRPKTSRK